MRRSILIAAAIAVVAVAGAAGIARYGMPKLSDTTAAPAVRAEPLPVAVVVTPAGQGEVRETITSLGTLKARQSVPIASQTGGIVTGISFTEGTFVEAGAPLVQLDSRIAQAQFDAAMAQLRGAQTRLVRSQELSGSGFRSKQSLDDDRTSLDSAASDVAVRKANLDLLSLRAPFKGVIGQKLFALGEYVAVGKTLAWLEDRTLLRLSFHVPERYYPRLALGQTIRLEVDAQPGRVYTGKVALIDTRPDLNDRDIEIRGELANDPEQLPPGLFARVGLVIGRKLDAIVVRPGTVQYTLTGAYVFKVDGDRVRKVTVKVGLQMIDRIELLEGVAPGDLLVTVGQFNLDDGRRISIYDRLPPPPPEPG